MSEETVEIVRKAVAHFESLAPPDWSLLHEEIELYGHDLLDAGPYHGHVGYVRWLHDWLDAWSESRMEAEEFIDTGDRVVVVFRVSATGRDSGITFQHENAFVYATQDGSVNRIDYFNSKQQALRAVGLER